ncbi:cation:proton antiporter [Neobacillus piezotolerans]|uniref:Cation:proton antiporter n=1 Tax=Neobacillus piezotolerans TaxID=2259171 RepID=A0A3D8GP60_9BACI|nr:cation:proton antiporter [Neobacillus piezotolerans]RDU35866.1 cation:proton antiporter [Neobacillus piezotolerans]
MNVTLAFGLFLLILFSVGVIGQKMFKIPDILLFIALGIFISPFFHEIKVIEAAGEVGLVLLFFLLGMKFPLKNLGAGSKKVWKAGLLDAVLGIVATTVLSRLFGLEWKEALLIGGIVFATSSSITAKLLEDKNRAETNESEFILLVLVFEDLVAPILLTVLIGFRGGDFTFSDFGFILTKIVLLAVVAVALSKVLFKRIEHFLESIKHEDSFIVLVAGIALTYGGIAILLGLSEVIGAFLAGIMLSDVMVKEKIAKVTLPVRNIFLPFFFLSFGMQIKLTAEIPYLTLLIVLLFWSVAQKIMVGYFGGRWYGLSKRESLSSGLSLTQRGEFSVIMAGLAAGHLKIFAGIYILVIALLGTILFQAAPKLNRAIFSKVAERKED